MSISHLVFFDLRLPSLQSTWLLQRSVAVCYPSCCFCVTSLSTRLLSASQLQSAFQSQLGVLSLSRQPLILVLLPCVDDFQYPCSSSSVKLLSSRHCSPRTSRPAVGTSLSVHLILSCCWLCSSVPLLQLIEILVDLLLVVVQVLRCACSFSAIWLCLFR